eukprot:SAG22_NODE_1756_length_3651_cov_52.815315_3_plen_506_part_00
MAEPVGPEAMASIEARATEYMKSLLAGVDKVPCDPKQKVERYFAAANMYLNKGLESGKAGIKDMDAKCTAYVYFMRYLEIGIGTILPHPALAKTKDPQLLQEHKQLNRTLPKVMEQMEKMKVQLKDDYIKRKVDELQADREELKRRAEEASQVPASPTLADFYDDGGGGGGDGLSSQSPAADTQPASIPPANSAADLSKLRLMMGDAAGGGAAGDGVGAAQPRELPESMFPSPTTAGDRPQPIAIAQPAPAAEVQWSGAAAGAGAVGAAAGVAAAAAAHQLHTPGLPPAFNPAVVQPPSYPVGGGGGGGGNSTVPPPPYGTPAGAWPQYQQGPPAYGQAAAAAAAPPPYAAVGGVGVDSRATPTPHHPPPAYPGQPGGVGGGMQLRPPIGGAAAAAAAAPGGDAGWKKPASASPQPLPRQMYQAAPEAGSLSRAPAPAPAGAYRAKRAPPAGSRPSKVLKVYGDGHCLYRSIACFLNPDIATLERNNFGAHDFFSTARMNSYYWC